MIFVIAVDYADARPPKDARRRYVHVEASTETEAHLIACQMVGCRPDCVMPTRSTTLEVEL